MLVHWVQRILWLWSQRMPERMDFHGRTQVSWLTLPGISPISSLHAAWLLCLDFSQLDYCVSLQHFALDSLLAPSTSLTFSTLDSWPALSPDFTFLLDLVTLYTAYRQLQCSPPASLLCLLSLHWPNLHTLEFSLLHNLVGWEFLYHSDWQLVYPPRKTGNF